MEAKGRGVFGYFVQCYRWEIQRKYNDNVKKAKDLGLAPRVLFGSDWWNYLYECETEKEFIDQLDFDQGFGKQRTSSRLPTRFFKMLYDTGIPPNRKANVYDVVLLRKKICFQFTRNISKLLAFTLTIMTICKPDIWAEQDQATRLGVVPQNDYPEIHW